MHDTLEDEQLGLLDRLCALDKIPYGPKTLSDLLECPTTTLDDVGQRTKGINP